MANTAQLKRTVTDAQVISLLRALTASQLQVVTAYLLVRDAPDRDALMARLRALANG
jgi:hypothetical protein